MPWWPEEEWAEKRRGAGCFLCAHAHHSNDEGDLVEATEFSFVHLKRNQSHPGHACVIFRRHEPELHDLSPEELRGFTTDVARVSRAIEAAFNPKKVDQLIIGHLSPHLHCHVFPQYESDDPRATPNIHDSVLVLDEAEQRARVELLQRHL